jgi:hypothetical protein
MREFRAAVMQARTIPWVVTLAFALVGSVGCGGDEGDPANAPQAPASAQSAGPTEPRKPAGMPQSAKERPQPDELMRRIIGTANGIFVGLVEVNLSAADASYRLSDRIQKVDYGGFFSAAIIRYRVDEVLLGNLEVGQSIVVAHVNSPGKVAFDAQGKLNTKLVHPGARLIVAATKRSTGWRSIEETRLPIVADATSIAWIRELIATTRRPIGLSGHDAKFPYESARSDPRMDRGSPRPASPTIDRNDPI